MDDTRSLHHARINIGRRLQRLEASLKSSSTRASLAQHAPSHDLLSMDLDHLAAALNSLLAESSTSMSPASPTATSISTTDPLLLSYADRLKSLQSLVAHAQQGQLDTRPRPLYNLKAARLASSGSGRGSASSGGAGNAKDLFDQLATEIRVQREAQEVKRRELLNLTSTASVSSESVSREVGGGIRQRGAKSSSAATATSSQSQSELDKDQSLDDHVRLQDTLTANLASMASILKANSLAFSEGLKSDAAVLDQSEQLLAANATRMASENTRLKKHRAAARWTTWTLVLVLVVVAAVSVGMFVVIKLFRK
ncbi:membrane fusion protein Use1-domain-containing protein [Catenaria anguillulae PL171]|uniref:Membrane fusion protein Use1-domain-containing protein n=1 Tax=Catenaria anguillulae PL171 TaxID=765915 RepID=A0A1Y2H6Y9_9FUNG|nr:membrane fusion protein Use1-domain-containing protein [Catenaria anguillulae PL171]